MSPVYTLLEMTMPGAEHVVRGEKFDHCAGALNLLLAAFSPGSKEQLRRVWRQR
jgi:hypothetical protein